VARQAKVVDIEPVGRRGGCRRLVVPSLFLIAGAVVVWYFFLQPKKPPTQPVEAADVRSSILQEDDSLRVAVEWRLLMPRGREVAESARVEVGVNDGEVAEVSTVPADLRADTLWVPAPSPGETASGYSCVTPMTRGRLTREVCTPWQFVRPAAGRTQADSAPARGGKKPQTPRTAAAVSRIEVQPSGIQVDLDVIGRCAAWQRRNPGRSVWVTVNKQAVAECTGPNGKPTVAQFCAFAVLKDGRRVMTLSAEKVEYCGELFREWREERTA
jgi:hypothetical protein